MFDCDWAALDCLEGRCICSDIEYEEDVDEDRYDFLKDYYPDGYVKDSED
ncbi:MAG: hypothetical protein LIO86_09710 [Lachnospiraceae bacterium]|nr:hypothetical protein [Lachnospiraceae bacterium]